MAKGESMKIETFGLERWMTRWELHVEYDIAESGILPMTARELLNLLPREEREPLLAELLDTPLGYSEAPGSLLLRTMLADTYHDTGPQNILVTTGAIEANFLLFNVLLSPGDHVVAVYPAYQQLYSVPRAIPCDVSLWTLRPENGFRYDLKELRHLVTPRTRLVVLNTPHNPTGVALSTEELREVYDIAGSVGAQVLCDEAYRWIEMPDSPPLACPVRDLGEHGISVGTLSKPFGLPGLRVGWIAGQEELIAACWAMRDYVSLSPAKLSDALATIALGCRELVHTHAGHYPPEPCDCTTVGSEPRRRRLVAGAAGRSALSATLQHRHPISRAGGPARRRVQRHARAGVGVRIRGVPPPRSGPGAGNLRGGTAPYRDVFHGSTRVGCANDLGILMKCARTGARCRTRVSGRQPATRPCRQSTYPHVACARRSRVEGRGNSV